MVKPSVVRERKLNGGKNIEITRKHNYKRTEHPGGVYRCELSGVWISWRFFGNKIGEQVTVTCIKDAQNGLNA